jgi:hypothetical protein
MGIVPNLEEQETMFARGLGLLNNIIVLLFETSTKVLLFGAEIQAEERASLMRLVFDLEGLKQEDGTFEGKLKTLVPEALSEDEEDGLVESGTGNHNMPENAGHSLLNGGNLLTLPIRERRNVDTVEESSSSE